MTDEHSSYRDARKWFASHGNGEYVNVADRTVHCNTVEGYFSIFKRGNEGRLAVLR